MASRRVVLTRSPDFWGIKEGAIAVKPRATRAGVIDKDEGRALGWQPTDEVVKVTLSHPAGGEGDDLGVVVFGDRGDRDRVVMAIQTDVARARLGHG
jgi:hypothetical protein